MTLPRAAHPMAQAPGMIVANRHLAAPTVRWPGQRCCPSVASASRLAMRGPPHLKVRQPLVPRQPESAVVAADEDPLMLTRQYSVSGPCGSAMILWNARATFSLVVLRR